MELTCRICLNTKKNNVIFPKELTLGLRIEFEYVVCNKCHSLSIRKIPKNLVEYYNKYPSLTGNPISLGFLKGVLYKNSIFRNSKLAKFALKLDRSYDSLKLKSLFPLNISPNSRILDVGCGKGELIQHLSLIGCKNLVGIDPFLKEKKIHIGNGIIKKTDLLDLNECYDIIMFHHSFEHMQNPKHVLEKIASLLRTGGKCLIRIPNVESFSFEYFKDAWEGIHPPFHITLPSRDGMSFLCTNTPLVLRKVCWEQPLQLVFHSLNRQVNIADFDHLGARLFYSTKKTYFHPPPLITKEEFKHWKKKSKLLAKTHMADYINYYFEKK